MAVPPSPVRRARRAAVVAPLAALLAALLAGGGALSCGDAGRVTSAAVAAVTVAPASVALEVGGGATLQATVLDAAGQAIAGQPIVWTSSDTTVVRIGADGRAYGVAAGVAEVAANTFGKFAKAAVVVGPRGVASLRIAPDAPRLHVGERVQLAADALHADGSPLAGRSVAWASGDPRVAVVDSAGALEGRAPGVATITATSEGRSATVTAVVTDVPVAALAVAPAVDTVVVGQSTQLAATARDAAGAVLTGRPVAWSAADAAVVYVSSAGLVLGVAPGTTAVHASADGRSARALVTVLPRPVGAVIVSPVAPALGVGDTVRLTVQTTGADGTLLAGRPVAFTTSDAAVARVTDAGLVTGVGVGVARIVVRSEERVGEVTVTVTAARVASVELEPASLALTVGQTATLRATARDAAGATVPGRAAEWISGAPGVVTVSPAGEVRAIAAGTAIVLASVDGRSATAEVVVRDAPAASLRLTPAVATLAPGEGIDLSAAVLDGAGNPLPGSSILFASSDERVATVTSAGRVRAVAAGTARIAATSGAATAVATITVVERVASVVVTGVPAALAVRETAQLRATALDRDARALGERAAARATSDAAVATVSASGLLTAVAPGRAVVTATVDGVVGSAPVTVGAPAPPTPVATVAVTLGAASLVVGQTTTATATLRDAGGAALGGRAVAWTTSDAAVATVSAEGVVTAVGAGAATIAATSEGKRGTAAVTVAAAPVAVASVAVSVAAGTLGVGETTQASAVVRDDQGRVLAGRAVAWASADPAVATVSAAGLVTAVAPGDAAIRATVDGRTGEAAVRVTPRAPAPVATVAVALASGALAVGQTTQATATARDASGAVLTGRAVAWSSSDAAVASVSASGVVTALAAGSATIRATSEGRSGTAPLAVSPRPVATVSVALGSATLAPLQGTTATATLRASDGTTLTGRAVSWSSSNPLVATVSGSGAVTAGLPGTATITAASEGRSGSATVTVQLLAPVVARVELSPGAVNLRTDRQNQRTATVTAVAYDLFGRVVPNAELRWELEPSGVAAVAADPARPGSATVTAARAGEATLTVSAGGARATARVTVRD